MEQDPINPIESAIINTVCTMIRPRLFRTILSLPGFNHRRIAYFLIEAIRAECKMAGRKVTLQRVVDMFDIKKDTYYEWREKWHHLLPEKITEVIG